MALPASAPRKEKKAIGDGDCPDGGEPEVNTATAMELCGMVAAPAPDERATSRLFRARGSAAVVHRGTASPRCVPCARPRAAALRRRDQGQFVGAGVLHGCMVVAG